MQTKISIYHGDITTLEADAIVNAANKALSGDEGVDGAIHVAAGPELLKECQTLNGCATGEAKLTKGYNLPAKYVIHTVGPIYGKEDGEEDELLANCYINSLRLAESVDAKILAFPNISTGIFRYPKDEAAELAINTVKNYLAVNLNTVLEKIIFVSFTEPDFKIFSQEFKRIMRK
ncbi:MAG: O-acetyl-ADP-ribose deacetylase [Patescibacteria group bacterium]|nr:O-acetyl-ADP-ribose deacetylase [Patescibacteria group bacterium]